MKFLTIALSAVLAFSYSDAQQTNKPLPFDGRCQSLTMDNVEKTYMLHILKMRGNSTTEDPAKYMKINPKGRSPAYNGDTGVMSVAVDDKAIFKDMAKFRRSEIVQFIEANPTGPTFFRASIRADEEIQNKYQWQAFFPESHIWDVYVDAKQSPPKLQFLADEYKVQYETEFKYKTWANVGIAVHGDTGLITFYASEGDQPLKEVFTTKKPLPKDKIPKDYELHFGMLVYSETPNPPMVANHQDVLQFNGITVDKVVGDAPAAAAGVGAKDAPTTGAKDAPTTAPSGETPAPVAATPGAGPTPAGPTPAGPTPAAANTPAPGSRASASKCKTARS